MPKLLVGLVGLSGCGKGTAADHLRTVYGADYVRFSGILGTVLEALGIEKSREQFIRISETLRGEYGEDVLSHAVAKQALFSEKDIVIIDGIRRLDDIVALEPLPQFVLVSIAAPAELRFERMKKRGEKASEANMTWEQFLKEEQASTEITIPAVMERATITLDNSGTAEELNVQLDAYIKKSL